MKMKQIRINYLEIQGNSKLPARVDFSKRLNIIYGASNTGKSYILKILDYMLGAEKLKKDIKLARGYSKILMGFHLEGRGDFVVERNINGGDYLLKGDGVNVILKSVHSNIDSFSNFILEYLKWDLKKLAKNQSGETQSLTLRNLAFLSLIDEVNIQAEISPLLTSNYSANTTEKSFFRYLLTFKDDSNIVAVVDDKTFKVNKEATVKVYHEILEDINSRLIDVKDDQEIESQLEKIENSIQLSFSDIDRLKESVNEKLKEKRSLLNKSSEIQDLIIQSNIHKSRFNVLDEIYNSDIERLKFVEEAGFLTLLNDPEKCKNCGVEIDILDNQFNISDGISSSLAEIKKIQSLKEDLFSTIKDVDFQLKGYADDLNGVENSINNIDLDINHFLSDLSIQQENINNLFSQRDFLRQGLDTLEQKKRYTRKLIAVEESSKPKKHEKPNLELSPNDLKEFSDIVSDVLMEWKFPGNNDVVFDLKNFDLLIDEQERVSNGKGVRALTHTAFKVATVLYCHKKNIPHPSFMVLDTPLLAYRDPISHKAGRLEDDEIQIQHNSVKEAFFRHLLKISNICQFIILENIDPPEFLHQQPDVQIIQFSGSSQQGRAGFFPI